RSTRGRAAASKSPGLTIGVSGDESDQWPDFGPLTPDPFWITPMAPSPLHRVAVYTGVFDPVHFGHLDVIERGSRLFERLVVGVGITPDKKSFFTLDERVELVREVTASISNVEVRPFADLAVRFVRQAGARIMLRGLRTLSDMEYEFSMSLTNFTL